MIGRQSLRFLFVAHLLLVLVLASCGGAPAMEPETVTEIKTVIVEKEVEVVTGAPAAEEPYEHPAPTATLAIQPTLLPESPSPIPTFQFPTPTPIIESRVVEVEWPERLHLGDSDVVRMALIPTREGYTITTEFPDHQTLTQDVPVVRPQGYYLYGIGRLNGVGFSIAPTEDQVRSLPLDETVVWHWSLTPQQPGQQRITLTLLLRWVPDSGSEGTIREAVAYSKGLQIQVSSFFGLTRRQAMTTGLFGAVFGGGLSLFALIYQPAAGGKEQKPRGRMLKIRPPNQQLVVETPLGVSISPQDRSILKSLFSRYARLVIQSEFLSGYSGARTFLLLPIRLDGRSDAHTIAKIGERSAIQREYQNYENFVKHTLPPVTARIQHPPVSSRGSDRAAMQYTFIGESGLLPVSLRQALLENPDPLLLNKLFEVFGPNWWMQRTPYTFQLAQEYDRFLPPHYWLEPDSGKAGRAAQVLDGNTTPGEVRLAIGDYVILRHFPTQEIRRDGQSFSIKGEAVPGRPSLRLRWQSAEPPRRQTGRVVAARRDLLQSYVAGFNLFGWPDPLVKLSRFLEENIVGTRSIIHGDLNLENVLVGPGDFVWLIDFATTREGHPLADFAHLEAEIIAHVLAPQLTADEYQRLLKSQEDFGQLLPGQEIELHESKVLEHQHLMSLRHTVGDIAAKCLANPSKPREYHLALYISCLSALKYQNLEPHQKHLLYLTAAQLAECI